MHGTGRETRADQIRHHQIHGHDAGCLCEMETTRACDRLLSHARGNARARLRRAASKTHPKIHKKQSVILSLSKDQHRKGVLVSTRFDNYGSALKTDPSTSSG